MQQSLLSKTIFFCLLVLGCFHAHAGITQDSASATATVTDSIPRTVTDIILVGNVLTKPQIILRELTFRKGQVLNPSSFEKLFVRSEDNLMNTSLFNSVHITWLINDQKTVTVYIILKERWYIFPYPIFELVDRNFNEWLRSNDFTKINYGGVVTWNNFRGRNETIGMTLRFGYTQRISFFYSIPFISKGQKSGLNFAFAFSRNHETSYQSIYNDLVYYKDENNFARKDISGSLQYTYRKGLYQTHALEAGYRRSEVEDTVIRLNPDYFSEGKSKEKYFTVRYTYRIEHRDLVAYPLHGSYFDAEAAKIGFGALNDDVNFSYLTSTYKRYWQLGRKFYFASAISGKLSDANPQPFYNIGGLGFGSNNLRGYEYYVMLGKKYALLKTNFKFELLPTHTVHASFIPLEKFATIPYAFYINVYGDGGYVEDHQYSHYNNLANSFQCSFGGGIDFVTYYDLVFRVEYSVNKFGESGIFIHFSAPI
jgi:outer membrane protein assembly factor BamA